MRTNSKGQELAEALQEEYDTALSRSSAEALLKKTVKFPINNNQFSALVPLAMFLGEHDFKRSALLRWLNEGKIFRAADTFRHYIHIWDEDGRFIDENLILQRERERSLFLLTEMVS